MKIYETPDSLRARIAVRPAAIRHRRSAAWLRGTAAGPGWEQCRTGRLEDAARLAKGRHADMQCRAAVRLVRTAPRPDGTSPRTRWTRLCRAAWAASVMLVVDQASRAREHVALRSMFAARKRVFVDLLKWDLPVLAGSFEVDRHDGPGATYLIVAGPGGEHQASVRLLPEPVAGLRPFDKYALKPGAPESGVVEVTHFCLSPDIAADDRRRARDQLLFGLVDHALAHRIHRLVGFAERRWARPIEDLGWACHRLGAVHSACRRTFVGIAVDVDATTPATLTRAGIERAEAGERMLP